MRTVPTQAVFAPPVHDVVRCGPELRRRVVALVGRSIALVTAVQASRGEHLGPAHDVVHKRAYVVLGAGCGGVQLVGPYGSEKVPRLREHAVEQFDRFHRRTVRFATGDVLDKGVTAIRARVEAWEAMSTGPSDPSGLTVPDTRGIVDPSAFFGRFTLTRHLPSADLDWAIDRYWVVGWDLRGEAPYDQQTIPFPAVNLYFTGGVAEIESVSTRRFVRRLEGRGQVLGVKFRPAGFRPMLGRPVSTVTGRRLPAAEVFGTAADDLGASLGAADDVNVRIAEVEAFLRSFVRTHAIRPHAMTAVVNQIVESIDADRSMTRVDDLAARLCVSTRRIQRLFAEHVGLRPKWVINRARIHDAVALAAVGETVDWSRLAVDLGYSDQSHLIREFRSAVGRSPAAYARQTRLSPGSVGTEAMRHDRQPGSDEPRVADGEAQPLEQPVRRPRERCGETDGGCATGDDGGDGGAAMTELPERS